MKGSTECLTCGYQDTTDCYDCPMAVKPPKFQEACLLIVAVAMTIPVGFVWIVAVAMDRFIGIIRKIFPKKEQLYVLD